MRKVTFGGACSLDGFIAAEHDAVDWLHFSPAVGEIMNAYLANVDTMIMGRRTWEVAMAQAGGSPGGAAEPSPITTYVFSRTLPRIDVPGVHLVRDDPGAFVRELKRRKGKDICVMGGGDLARSLFAADVIDEVGFNVHPILLGAGVRAFHDAGRRVRLELQELRQLPGGCAYMVYRVKHARTAIGRSAPEGQSLAAALT